MTDKFFTLVALAFFSLTTNAGSNELDVDIFFLKYLVAEAKKSQVSNVACKYLSNNERLLNEFYNHNRSITDAKYTDAMKNEVTAFIPAQKAYRPGLTLIIHLNEGECVGFDLGEIMN